VNVKELAHHFTRCGVLVSDVELRRITPIVRNLLSQVQVVEVDGMEHSLSFKDNFTREISRAKIISGMLGSDKFAALRGQDFEPSASLKNIQDRFGCFIEIFDAPHGEGDAVLPIAIKDVFGFGAHRPSGGVPTRSDHIKVPKSSAIERLVMAGASIVGTTKLSPWCYLPLEQNSSMEPPTNPLGSDLLVGGSSSGSAVAVAAGAVLAALGTDTGGSVRIPAALCGLYGFKPTVGRVPIDGVVPLGKTQDTVGILAKDPRYLRLLFDAMKSDHVEPDRGDSGKYNFCIPANGFDFCDGEISQAGNLMREVLVAGGADIVSCPPLPLDAMNKYAAIITGFEAARLHLLGLRDHPEDYVQSVRDRLLVGLAIDDQNYQHALDWRGACLNYVLEQIFSGSDFLILPTVNRYAQTREQSREGDGSSTAALSVELLSMNRWVNMLGLPAITVPVPLPDKIPAAIQIVGRHYSDEALIKIAARLF
jgi:aspartyl-tRNA(Asn)/glutamyl-tRNA(Gln) amidotransferase subunit A